MALRFIIKTSNITSSIHKQYFSDCSHNTHSRRYFKYDNGHVYATDMFDSSYVEVHNTEDIKILTKLYYKKGNFFIYNNGEFEFKELTLEDAENYWKKNKEKILKEEEIFNKKLKEINEEITRAEKLRIENEKIERYKKEFSSFTDNMKELLEKSDNKDEVLVIIAGMFEANFKQLTKKKLLSFNLFK